MHLLNDNITGPGELWNLTPGPTKSNNDMTAGVEKNLKKAILDLGAVMTFTAEVDYKNDPMTATTNDIDDNPDKYRFNHIAFKATQWAADSATKKYKPGVNVDQEVKNVNGAKVTWQWGTLPPLVPKPLILSTADWKELKGVGISEAAAKRIVAFNAAGGFANVGKLAPTADKQQKLLDAVKLYDGGNNFKLSWKANDVYWR
jgi:hypothetical protein